MRAIIAANLLRCLALACCLPLIALPVFLFAADQEPTNASTVARQTVARALGIDPAGVRVISSEPRDFPDASLDCRQPDTAYAQVITPGFRVLVEASGRRFDVRVAGTAGSICYRRKPRTETPADEDTKPRQLGEAAREDLALRLGVPLETVTVTGLRRLTPGDTLPGCEEVCAANSPPSVCGVSVQMRAGDRNFDYVALPGVLRPCPDIASR
jgi:hypothetical protein